MGKKKRKSSFHGLKAHISYACIYNGSSYLQCGRDKEKGSATKRKTPYCFSNGSRDNR